MTGRRTGRSDRLWRLSLVVAILAGLLTGCALVRPKPDCRLDSRCDAVLAAARQVVPLDDARVVVLQGRGLAFHAEIHACYPDGRYVLVDVVGDSLAAAARDQPWDSPPCR